MKIPNKLELTAAGTVPDFHGIPFSAILSGSGRISTSIWPQDTKEK
jgi:hypothetical protein